MLAQIISTGTIAILAISVIVIYYRCFLSDPELKGKLAFGFAIGFLSTLILVMLTTGLLLTEIWGWETSL